MRTPGEVITIYRDVRTRRHEEGEARVIRFLGADSLSERYEVEFLDTGRRAVRAVFVADVYSVGYRY